MIKVIQELPVNVRPGSVGDSGISIYYLNKDKYSRTVCAVLAAAKKRIRVTMFGVSAQYRKTDRLHNSVYHALVRAAELGVTCQAVLSEYGPYATNKNFNYQASQGLIEAGCKIRWARRSALLHQKQIIVDDHIVIIGSHNIGQSSITRNRDVSVLIDSKDFASIAMKEFQYCWTNGYK